MGVNQVKKRCGMQETVDPTKNDKGKHQILVMHQSREQPV